jgi:PDZ domain-containing protein/aspartyl protease
VRRILLALLMFCAPAIPRLLEAAQGIPEHPPLAGRIDLSAGAEGVAVPFKLVNHHLILPVRVNGQGPLRIVLDTGMPAEGLALHDTEKTQALHLTYASGAQVRVGGVGGSGKAHPTRVATGLSLEIGDLKLLDAGAILLPPIPGFASYSDGVIGAALFRHFAVTVDNDRGVVILRRPEAYRPPPEATVVPLVEGAPAPSVNARVRLGDSAPVPVKLAVDLGASHALSLNESRALGIGPPSRSIATIIGRGLGGPLTGKVGRIRALELGGIVLPEMVATFPDRKFLSQEGVKMADGNLGDGTLSRFNFTVDYTGKRLVLQPARNFAEPFEWDMSGMTAEVTDDGSVRVREVVPGSPAAEAGVRKDDRVVRIAGETVDSASYFDLREKLRHDGETVKVDLLRGKKPVGVSLKLRRLI